MVSDAGQAEATNVQLADSSHLPLGTLPAACAVVTALAALYIFLAAFGNITDYDTNFAFVQHVLAMDTTNFGAAPGTELDPNVMWRAIQSPSIHTAAYIGIILWESLTAVVLGIATAHWMRGWRTRSFAGARQWASLGFLMLVVLFTGGFIVIGGEWFQMWRSTAWNGLAAALQNSVLALFGLVLVHLPSRDWSGERRG